MTNKTYSKLFNQQSSYDNNDNIIQDTINFTTQSHKNYQYDHQDRLTKDSHNNHYFAYDKLGNITSTNQNNQGNNQSTQTEARTTNDDNQYTQITQNSNSINITISYDANGNLASYQDKTYTYDLLNRLTSISQNTTTIVQYYYLKDRLGSVVGLINNNQQLVESYHYNTFGKLTIKDHDQNIIPKSNYNNPYAYTGRRFDNESGLHYYRNRYYQPNLARFISQDPKGYIDVYNLYAYVKNNPLRYTDPFGTTAQQTNYDYQEEWSNWDNDNDWDSFNDTSYWDDGDNNSSQDNPGTTTAIGGNNGIINTIGTTLTKSVNQLSEILDVVTSGASGKVVPGYGIHAKGKLGPFKVGTGTIVGAGGAKLNSKGLSTWGKSTTDIELSAFKYGGRAYLWDIDIDSSGVNNIDILGIAKPTWDWSIGAGVTFPPYSVEVEYDFQPLKEYIYNQWNEWISE